MSKDVVGDFDCCEAIEGLEDLLAHMHRREPDLAAVKRIAVAVYDGGVLHTFSRCGEGGDALNNYAAPLNAVPSLAELARTGQSRTVDDMLGFGRWSEHSRRVLDAGFRSSLTMPLKSPTRLEGMLFFNSRLPGFFSPATLEKLWPYGQIARLLALRRLAQAELIRGAVNTIRRVSQFRDEETGGHLERMALYTRVIGKTLAAPLRLSDEFIELVCRFAPMHDIGKLAVPDAILLKPGPLDKDEARIMRTHVQKGREIVEMMLTEFGLTHLGHVDILRNVVSYHHEAWDGSGYPHCLAGDAIPIEAVIVKAADVFDALTSVRPYKTAWSNGDALAFMAEQRGRQFHPLAVDALLAEEGQIAEIQRDWRSFGGWEGGFVSGLSGPS